MAKKSHDSSRSSLIRITKLHLILGVAFAVQLIAYDASKLITPEVIFQRWAVTGLFVALVAVIWTTLRLRVDAAWVKRLALTLVASDIALASYHIYTQRGMASRAVILYVLGILTAACLHRKAIIYLTSTISVVAYIVTAIAYFTFNFNEGYKIELYGEIGFYSVVLLLTGGMAWALVRQKH